MIQATSKEAFQEVRETLGERQRMVYNALKQLKSAPDKQLLDYLGWGINCITNRRGELVNSKLVGFDKYVLNEQGRRVMSWKIVRELV